MKPSAFLVVAIVDAEESDTLLQAARLQKHTEEYDPTILYNYPRGAFGAPGCVEANGGAFTGAIEDCTNKDFFTWKGQNKETFENPTYFEPTYQPGDYGKDTYWETTPVNNTVGWETSCVAYVRTKDNGETCAGWCAKQGLVCNIGMDDAHWQVDDLSQWLGTETGCTLQPVSSTLSHKLPPSSKAIDQSDNGCNAEWNTQICGCAKPRPCCDGTPWPCPHIVEGCPPQPCVHWPGGSLPEGAIQDCTHSDFHVWKGEKGKEGDTKYVDPTYRVDSYGADKHWTTAKVKDYDHRYAPDDVCVAYVDGANLPGGAGGRQSCNDWCESAGMTCVRGMDDAHWQVGELNAWQTANNMNANSCTLFPKGANRQSTSNNGCDQTYKTQICACKA